MVVKNHGAFILIFQEGTECTSVEWIDESPQVLKEAL
jgi:hypothetical protein